VPEISRFFGMVVTMYYNDHDPPHFHVRYGKRKALMGIRPLEMLARNLPPKALDLVGEWACQHESELMADWDLHVLICR
jgi:hypothetical protein